MNSVKSSFIHGVWRMKEVHEDHLVRIRNPWNDELVYTYAESGFEEISEAISDAQEAVNRELPPRVRANILSRASDLLAQRIDQAARLLTKETGKPIRDARLEVSRAVKNFKASSEEAARIHGYTEEQESVDGERIISMTVKEPLGVICAITPFNFPFNITALKIGPALAAGNAVILKPADATPGTAAFIVDLMMEAGLPPGYLNLVLGGAEVGKHLVTDSRIALYTFTGSVAVGEEIKRNSGIRPVILELGSSAPNIVHRDADMDSTVEALVKASFSFAGQVCVSAQRIFVHEDILDEFLRRFTARVNNLRLGDPMDEQTEVGPLIHSGAALRVERFVHHAVEQGAVALSGGPRQGNIIPPVVLTNVTPDMDVMKKELFGPVVNVLGYQTIEEVIEKCNESDFGLQAGVFTTDIDVAFAIAHGLKIGSVNINQSSTARPDTMPYGGIKNSGIGQEGSRFSVDSMSHTKIITIRHSLR